MISDTIPESESLQRICRPLLDWYRENCRDLEWRRSPLPYYVWLSEIMLQQTRVEGVKPYFSRFVKEVPDIPALADSSEDRLLKLWEGLGYYSRIRNMHKAARIVMERYDGALPADVALLKALPGIGPYVAGAIASIAYDIPAPAVDGNVLRVISRLTASKACIDESRTRASIEKRIRDFLVEEYDWVRPGEFNQALMELGAVVCVPNGSPLCDACPAAGMCRARAAHLTGSIPVRKQKKARRIQKRTVLVIRDDARALLRKRPAGGLLANLWEPPNYEGHLTQDDAMEEAKKLGLSVKQIQPLPDAKHIFTHLEWHMKGYLVHTGTIDPEQVLLCQSGMQDAGRQGEEESMFFAMETETIRQACSIPAAFAAYRPWLGRMSSL